MAPMLRYSQAKQAGVRFARRFVLIVPVGMAVAGLSIGTGREAYRTALDTEILLLDDLGAQRVTEWTEDTVTSLITYRCNHRKPLIATTNLPDSDATGKVVDYTGPGGTPVYKKMLADIVGVRVRSRLFEMCRVVRMPEVEDYRMRKAR